jgi:hypothetical protein
LIEGDLKSPHVDFNHLTGDLILSGRSIPENAAKVYEPLIEWIQEYVKSPRKVTNFRLHLEYYNSASTIWIGKLVNALGSIDKQDHVLFIHLYFDVEDYEEMSDTEIKHYIGSLIDNIEKIKISIGVKTYATDPSGKILKESTILI